MDATALEGPGLMLTGIAAHPGIVLPERQSPPITLLESTVRMKERADCPVAMGETLAGKYELERVIGIGGMGVVVLAWHTELQQLIALKLLRESFAQHAEARERFRREARAAARISSDHVVRVLDVATLDNGVPYMVMEYLEGQNLRDLLRTVGPLEEHEVASIVIQMCEALAEAHANQIVHRDLKPENIFLAHRGKRHPVVKVLDFGVSKSLSSNTIPHLKLTPASMLRGSPAYMSPEQLDCSRPFDARSDIWGVGVLMFELLTQHLPFQGETLPQLICAVLAGERSQLSAYRQRVSPVMEEVLARCLTPTPDDRFPTVQALAQALRPLAVTHDHWATRLAPHLVPNAADAGAYGKAHIVGESVRDEGPAVQPMPAIDPALLPAVSCAPTFLAAPAHWPAPQALRPKPLDRKPALGVALGAAIGGGLAAILVVVIVLIIRQSPRSLAPAELGPAELGPTATLREPSRAVRPSIAAARPGTPPAPTANAPRSALPAPKPVLRAQPATAPAAARAPAGDATPPPRAIPKRVPARVAPPVAAEPAPTHFDPNRITDFGGRR